jgi:hypothetical protein
MITKLAISGYRSPRDIALALSVWNGETLGRSNAFAVRHGPSVPFAMTAGRGGRPMIAWFDSMMTYCSDPGNGLELLLLRERLRD